MSSVCTHVYSVVEGFTDIWCVALLTHFMYFGFKNVCIVLCNSTVANGWYVPFSCGHAGGKCVLCYFNFFKSLSIILISVGDIRVLKLSVTNLGSDVAFFTWTNFQTRDVRHLIGYYLKLTEAWVLFCLNH